MKNRCYTLLAVLSLAIGFVSCTDRNPENGANTPRVITGPENGTGATFRDPLMYPGDTSHHTAGEMKEEHH